MVTFFYPTFLLTNCDSSTYTVKRSVLALHVKWRSLFMYFSTGKQYKRLCYSVLTFTKWSATNALYYIPVSLPPRDCFNSKFWIPIQIQILPSRISKSKYGRLLISKFKYEFNYSSTHPCLQPTQQYLYRSITLYCTKHITVSWEIYLSPIILLCSPNYKLCITSYQRIV